MKHYFNHNIKDYTTFGINSFVSEFYEFETISELEVFIKGDSLQHKKHLIIGGGSNLLFVGNYDGIIIKANFLGIEILKEDNEFVYIKAGAAEVWDDFVQFCVDRKYWGSENLSLIPGTIGASPVQNIGAYGTEVKDIIYQVNTINKDNGEIESFKFDDCQFAYRDSIFKKEGHWVVTDVIFRLKIEGSPNLSYAGLKSSFADNSQPSLTEIRNTIVDIRNAKLPDPIEIGNAGSFFKNPIVSVELKDKLLLEYPDMPFYSVSKQESKLAAGWLIEKANWKGKRLGEAGVHNKQALVLVNHGKATGQEIFHLSEEIISSIKKKFNITLEKEVISIQ